MNPGEAPKDATLARRAAEGDDQAFGALVRRHQKPLYRLLRRYTGDADQAHEAAHEAFIAAWMAIRRYDPKRPFTAWLRTIALNKARDRGRRMTVRRLLFGADGLDGRDAKSHADPAPPADEVLAERQEAASLGRAISHLPSGLKAALLLTVFEGCSHREAAEIMGVSAKTIEGRVRRARELLARGFKPDLNLNARTS